MTRLLRILLGRWALVIITLAVASAPLHAVAHGWTSDVRAVASTAHHKDAGCVHPGSGQDFDGGAATSRACCHAGCVAAVSAVVPTTSSMLPRSAPARITADRAPPATDPSGLDRPPKRA